MAVPGEPGHEAPGGAPIVVPGTRVDLYISVDGGETLVFLHEEDDELEHAQHRDRPRRDRRLVVGYIAEHPTPAAPTSSSSAAVQAIEADVERANEVAESSTRASIRLLADALEVARERATQRQQLAAGLKPPKSYERWWGRP